MPAELSSQILRTDYSTPVGLANVSMSVMTSTTDISDMTLSTVLANTVVATTLRPAGETVTAGLVNAVTALPTYVISGGEPPELYDPDTASQIWYVS
jgi:hypothetical protein